MAAGAVSACGSDDVRIVERRAPSAEQDLFLIGPGAAGKTTLGRVLAPLLGYALIDLDETFLDRIGDIGAYI